MKKIIKAIGLCLGVIVLAAAAFILYLFVTDYRPQDEEEVVLEGSGSRAIAPGDALSVLTFNIGYGGLDADTDFFMDGGSAVLATSKEKVESNISGVGDILTRENTDVVFLQEVDLDSKRSWNVNEAEASGRASFRPEHGLWCELPLPLYPISLADDGKSRRRSGYVQCTGGREYGGAQGTPRFLLLAGQHVSAEALPAGGTGSTGRYGAGAGSCESASGGI